MSPADALPVTWIGASTTHDPSNSFSKTERELARCLPASVKVTPYPWPSRELVRIGPVGLGGVLSKYVVAGRPPIPRGVPHLLTQDMAFLLAKRRFAEAVITVHDIHVLLGEVDVRSRFGRFMDARLTRKGLRDAKRVVVNSAFTKSTLVEACGTRPENVRVAHVGVSERYRPIPGLDRKAVKRRLGVPDGAKVLLYVGSEHPRKNVAGILRAMARARELTRAPFVLVKVGGEVFRGGRALTVAEAERLGLAKQVIFAGRLDDDAVVEAMNAADCLVFPSRFEGFGLHVAEAMACGTPVVTSNVTSLPEVAGDAALLAAPDDVEGLARHVVDVIENGRDDLRAKGIARAKRFTWQAFADAHVEAYREAARALGL